MTEPYYPQFALPRRTTALPATAPSITSVTFDKQSYNPGQQITATVTYAPGTSPVTQTLTGSATDSTSGLNGQLVVNFVVTKTDTTTIAVTDTGNRVWTKASDSGTVAVFTATA